MVTSYGRFDGDERGATDYIATIKHFAIDGNMTMEAAMQKEGGELPPQEVQEKMRTLLITLNEAELFGNMQTSREMGMDDQEITGFTTEMAEAAAAGTLSMMSGEILDEEVTTRKVTNDDGRSQEVDREIEAAGEKRKAEVENAGERAKDEARRGAERVSNADKRRAATEEERTESGVTNRSQSAVDNMRRNEGGAEGTGK